MGDLRGLHGERSAEAGERQEKSHAGGLAGEGLPAGRAMICDICGKDRPDVNRVLDPYDADVNDVEIERDLCDDCYQERRDDI